MQRMAMLNKIKFSFCLLALVSGRKALGKDDTVGSSSGRGLHDYHLHGPLSSCVKTQTDTIISANTALVLTCVLLSSPASAYAWYGTWRLRRQGIHRESLNGLREPMHGNRRSVMPTMSVSPKFAQEAGSRRDSRRFASLPRRGFLAATAAVTAGLFAPLPRHQSVGIFPIWSFGVPAASAFVAGSDEEVSGLVVLRVAEVCAFQEKLLRLIATCGTLPSGAKGPVDQFGNAYCESEAYSVQPAQIVFGTEVLLTKANVDGNLKLMIATEISKENKEAAIKDAVAIMNNFGKLMFCASQYRKLGTFQLNVLADIYSDIRGQLARFFDYLPKESKEKFYGYAEEVRKYEQKESGEYGIERMKLTND